MSTTVLQCTVSQCKNTPKVTITHEGRCNQTTSINSYQKMSKIIQL